MFLFSKVLRSTTIFRTTSEGGMWRVTRDGYFLASYWSEGDARRGACLNARRTEMEGGAARVLAASGVAALWHNEPQFGR